MVQNLLSVLKVVVEALASAVLDHLSKANTPKPDSNKQ